MSYDECVSLSGKRAVVSVLRVAVVSVWGAVVNVSEVLW